MLSAVIRSAVEDAAVNGDYGVSVSHMVDFLVTKNLTSSQMNKAWEGIKQSEDLTFYINDEPVNSKELNTLKECIEAKVVAVAKPRVIHSVLGLGEHPLQRLHYEAIYAVARTRFNGCWQFELAHILQTDPKATFQILKQIDIHLPHLFLRIPMSISGDRKRTVASWSSLIWLVNYFDIKKVDSATAESVLSHFSKSFLTIAYNYIRSAPQKTVPEHILVSMYNDHLCKKMDYKMLSSSPALLGKAYSNLRVMLTRVYKLQRVTLRDATGSNVICVRLPDTTPDENVARLTDAAGGDAVENEEEEGEKKDKERVQTTAKFRELTLLEGIHTVLRSFGDEGTTSKNLLHASRTAENLFKELEISDMITKEGKRDGKVFFYQYWAKEKYNPQFLESCEEQGQTADVGDQTSATGTKKRNVMEMLMNSAKKTGAITSEPKDSLRSASRVKQPSFVFGKGHVVEEELESGANKATQLVETRKEAQAPNIYIASTVSAPQSKKGGKLSNKAKVAEANAELPFGSLNDDEENEKNSIRNERVTTSMRNIEARCSRVFDKPPNDEGDMEKRFQYLEVNSRVNTNLFFFRLLILWRFLREQRVTLFSDAQREISIHENSTQRSVRVLVDRRTVIRLMENMLLVDSRVKRLDVAHLTGVATVSAIWYYDIEEDPSIGRKSTMVFVQDALEDMQTQVPSDVRQKIDILLKNESYNELERNVISLMYQHMWMKRMIANKMAAKNYPVLQVPALENGVSSTRKKNQAPFAEGDHLEIPALEDHRIASSDSLIQGDTVETPVYKSPRRDPEGEPSVRTPNPKLSKMKNWILQSKSSDAAGISAPSMVGELVAPVSSRDSAVRTFISESMPLYADTMEPGPHVSFDSVKTIAELNGLIFSRAIRLKYFHQELINIIVKLTAASDVGKISASRFNAFDRKTYKGSTDGYFFDCDINMEALFDNFTLDGFSKVVGIHILDRTITDLLNSPTEKRVLLKDIPPHLYQAFVHSYGTSKNSTPYRKVATMLSALAALQLVKKNVHVETCKVISWSVRFAVPGELFDNLQKLGFTGLPYAMRDFDENPNSRSGLYQVTEASDFDDLWLRFRDIFTSGAFIATRVLVDKEEDEEEEDDSNANAELEKILRQSRGGAKFTTPYSIGNICDIRQWQTTMMLTPYQKSKLENVALYFINKNYSVSNALSTNAQSYLSRDYHQNVGERVEASFEDFFTNHSNMTGEDPGSVGSEILASFIICKTDPVIIQLMSDTKLSFRSIEHWFRRRIAVFLNRPLTSLRKKARGDLICTMCDASFAEKNLLIKHFNVIHSITEQDIPNMIDTVLNNILVKKRIPQKSTEKKQKAVRQRMSKQSVKNVIVASSIEELLQRDDQFDPQVFTQEQVEAIMRTIVLALKLYDSITGEKQEIMHLEGVQKEDSANISAEKQPGDDSRFVASHTFAFINYVNRLRNLVARDIYFGEWKCIDMLDKKTNIRGAFDSLVSDDRYVKEYMSVKKAVERSTQNQFYFITSPVKSGGKKSGVSGFDSSIKNHISALNEMLYPLKEQNLSAKLRGELFSPGTQNRSEWGLINDINLGESKQQILNLWTDTKRIKKRNMSNMKFPVTSTNTNALIDSYKVLATLSRCSHVLSLQTINDITTKPRDAKNFLRINDAMNKLLTECSVGDGMNPATKGTVVIYDRSEMYGESSIDTSTAVNVLGTTALNSGRLRTQWGNRINWKENPLNDHSLVKCNVGDEMSNVNYPHETKDVSDEVHITNVVSNGSVLSNSGSGDTLNMYVHNEVSLVMSKNSAVMEDMYVSEYFDYLELTDNSCVLSNNKPLTKENIKTIRQQYRETDPSQINFVGLKSIQKNFKNQAQKRPRDVSDEAIAKDIQPQDYVSPLIVENSPLLPKESNGTGLSSILGNFSISRFFMRKTPAKQNQEEEETLGTMKSTEEPVEVAEPSLNDNNALKERDAPPSTSLTSFKNHDIIQLPETEMNGESSPSSTAPAKRMRLEEVQSAAKVTHTSPSQAASRNSPSKTIPDEEETRKDEEEQAENNNSEVSDPESDDSSYRGNESGNELAGGRALRRDSDGELESDESDSDAGDSSSSGEEEEEEEEERDERDIHSFTNPTEDGEQIINKIESSKLVSGKKKGGVHGHSRFVRNSLWVPISITLDFRRESKIESSLCYDEAGCYTESARDISACFGSFEDGTIQDKAPHSSQKESFSLSLLLSLLSTKEKPNQKKNKALHSNDYTNISSVLRNYLIAFGNEHYSLIPKLKSVLVDQSSSEKNATRSILVLPFSSANPGSINIPFDALDMYAFYSSYQYQNFSRQENILSFATSMYDDETSLPLVYVVISKFKGDHISYLIDKLRNITKMYGIELEDVLKHFEVADVIEENSLTTKRKAIGSPSREVSSSPMRRKSTIPEPMLVDSEGKQTPSRGNAKKSRLLFSPSPKRVALGSPMKGMPPPLTETGMERNIFRDIFYVFFPELFNGQHTMSDVHCVPFYDIYSLDFPVVGDFRLFDIQCYSSFINMRLLLVASLDIKKEQDKKQLVSEVTAITRLYAHLLKHNPRGLCSTKLREEVADDKYFKEKKLPLPILPLSVQVLILELALKMIFRSPCGVEFQWYTSSQTSIDRYCTIKRAITNEVILGMYTRYPTTSDVIPNLERNVNSTSADVEEPPIQVIDISPVNNANNNPEALLSNINVSGGKAVYSWSIVNSSFNKHLLENGDQIPPSTSFVTEEFSTPLSTLPLDLWRIWGNFDEKKLFKSQFEDRDGKGKQWKQKLSQHYETYETTIAAYTISIRWIQTEIMDQLNISEGAREHATRQSNYRPSCVWVRSDGRLNASLIENLIYTLTCQNYGIRSSLLIPNTFSGLIEECESSFLQFSLCQQKLLSCHRNTYSLFFQSSDTSQVLLHNYLISSRD